MRQILIAGNWKMNNTIGAATKLLKELKEKIPEETNKEILVCPPFTALFAASAELKMSNIKLGAQNVFYEREGAFTGEISGDMLKEIGCEYVIIGHSERRAYFHETNETVNKKINAVLTAGLKVIMCVGETFEQREKESMKNVIGDHVKNGLRDIKDISNVVIAYEPVWAIGTGKTATPEQAQEVHAYIRQMLTEMYSAEVSEETRILYGGSVKPENAYELLFQKDIDGALVGGASLDAEKFAGIINA